MKSKFAAAKTIFAALLHSLMHPLKTMHMLNMAAALTADLTNHGSNASRGYYSRKCRRARTFKRLFSNGMVKEAQRYAV
jgi:hypothetical protein